MSLYCVLSGNKLGLNIESIIHLTGPSILATSARSYNTGSSAHGHGGRPVMKFHWLENVFLVACVLKGAVVIKKQILFIPLKKHKMDTRMNE